MLIALRWHFKVPQRLLKNACSRFYNVRLALQSHSKATNERISFECLEVGKTTQLVYDATLKAFPPKWWKMPPFNKSNQNEFLEFYTF